MYYTATKHSAGTFEKTREMQKVRVLSRFPSCSQMPVVVYRSVIHGLGFFVCQIKMKMMQLDICSKLVHTSHFDNLCICKQQMQRLLYG